MSISLVMKIPHAEVNIPFKNKTIEAAKDKGTLTNQTQTARKKMTIDSVKKYLPR